MIPTPMLFLHLLQRYTLNKMKIYLSGPITGLPDLEVAENFYKAVIDISRKYPKAQIINPYERCKYMPFTEWKDFMQVCLKMLGECDIIYMMQGWEKSYGCNTEYFFAAGCKIRIEMYNEDIP